MIALTQYNPSPVKFFFSSSSETWISLAKSFSLVLSHTTEKTQFHQFFFSLFFLTVILFQVRTFLTTTTNPLRYKVQCSLLSSCVKLLAPWFVPWLLLRPLLLPLFSSSVSMVLMLLLWYVIRSRSFFFIDTCYFGGFSSTN